MAELQAHIRLDKTINAKHAIMPGDPARIDRIIPFLESARELGFNREYRAIIGTYKGVRVLAISSGIGGPSAAIAVEELKNIGVENIIRIGSCGALQENIDLGELVIAQGAVRDEGTSKAYVEDCFPAVADHRLISFCEQAAQNNDIAYHFGIIRSNDSFYIDNEQEVCKKWSKLGVLGADMETAALYTVGHLRGIRTASILNNVVKYGVDVSEGIDDYAAGDTLTMQGERNEILVALEAFVLMERSNGEKKAKFKNY